MARVSDPSLDPATQKSSESNPQPKPYTGDWLGVRAHRSSILWESAWAVDSAAYSAHLQKFLSFVVFVATAVFAEVTLGLTAGSGSWSHPVPKVLLGLGTAIAAVGALSSGIFAATEWHFSARLEGRMGITRAR